MYQYTDEMDEISGFGGAYEAMCRKMVLAGVEWLEAHPNANPKFHGYKNIYGIIEEDNEDAKQLSHAVSAAADFGETGAMHQATISHCLHIKAVGWETYVQEMIAKKQV